jgi:nitric oxide reductase NorE protein
LTNASSGALASQASDVSPVEHGPDDEQRVLPGQPDMWAFVLFEALVFTGYFAVYVVRRMQDHALYVQSQARLDLQVGVLNTLVLLLSSWSVARCVQAAREGAYASALTSAFLTGSFGLVFLLSKVIEWAREIGEGFTFTHNEFFTFYYFLTGLHFVHLLIGFVVLGIIICQLRSPERRAQRLIETGATYWHTVDFLWVMIFSLLYVMR